MLKREYAAAAVLAALIAISGWNMRRTDTLTSDMEIALCKSRAAAERLDFKRSREYMKDSFELWNDAECYTRIFISEELADRATDAFYTLQEALAQEDTAACATSYDSLRHYLETINEMERPSLGSIF